MLIQCKRCRRKLAIANHQVPVEGKLVVACEQCTQRIEIALGIVYSGAILCDEDEQVSPRKAQAPRVDTRSTIEPEPFDEPGEDTKVVMMRAGMFSRRLKLRLTLGAAFLFLFAFVGLVIADIRGMVWLPGMGVVYEMTGVEDPNPERAIERIEEQLATQDSDTERTEQLLARLEKQRLRQRRSKGVGAKPTVKRPDEPTSPAVEPSRDINLKISNGAAFAEISNMPPELDFRSMVTLLSERFPSLQPCLEDLPSLGAGLEGRLVISLLVANSGDVKRARVKTKRFARTRVSKCLERTVGGWTFPRFTGKPMRVSYPIIIREE